MTILSIAVFAAGLTAGLIVAGAIWAFARSALTERATELAARDASLGLL